ncbi:MAG: hypothetical protein NVS3B3_19770 [Aquirhabdus sp.]
MTIADRMTSLLQGQSVFAIVDAAAGDDIQKMIREYDGEKFCVVQGWKQEMYANFSPWLFALKIEEPSFKKMIDQFWGNSWGIFFCSSLPAEKLIKYFRENWIVSLPDGSHQYFRYYDPRVFRAFFPVALADQLKFFFREDIYGFFAESEDGQFLHCYYRKKRSLIETMSGESPIKELKISLTS